MIVVASVTGGSTISILAPARSTHRRLPHSRRRGKDGPPSFYASLAVMFMLGGAMSAFQSLNGSLLLSSADMEYHGRVQSLVMLSYSAFGLAALPFGIIADRVGLRPTMFAMALAVLVGAGHRRRL